MKLQCLKWVNLLWKEQLLSGIKKLVMLVKKDETIFEISTDKVDTEIPSPEAGTLCGNFVGEQETVEVGTIVAKLGCWLKC